MSRLVLQSVGATNYRNLAMESGIVLPTIECGMCYPTLICSSDQTAQAKAIL